MTRINIYLSIASLTIKGLNSPVKRHRLTDWIRKQDLSFAASKKHTSPIKIDITFCGDILFVPENRSLEQATS